MNKNDKHFMLEAIKESKKSRDNGDWPVGCVIVIANEIVARGNNKVYSKSNKIHHAEIDAMTKVPDLLVKEGNLATMYVTYEPCPMCLGAIMLNHIKRVVCGSNIDKSGALNLMDHLPSRFDESKYRFELTNNFMEEECQKVFLSGRPVKKLKL